MQMSASHCASHTAGTDQGKKPLWMLCAFLLLLLPACAVKTPPPQAPSPTEEASAPQAETTPFPAKPKASESAYYYYTEAQIRLNRNRPLEALGFLRQAVALNPQSAFLQRELAAILVRSGQPQAALQAIERARDLDPRDPDTLIVLAGIRQMLEQDIQELIPLYEEVIRLDPGREKIYLILGNLYLAQKKPRQAEAIYRDLIAHHPENYAGYYYLGQLLALLGRQEEALGNFDRVIGLAPHLLEPYLDRIRILTQQLTHSLSVEILSGDTLDALLIRYSGSPSPRLHRQVLALNPLLEDVDHLEVGKKILMPPKKKHPLVADIRRSYENLLAMTPDSVEVITDYALFLRKMGEEEKARLHMAGLARQEEARTAVIRRVFTGPMEAKRYRDGIFLLEELLSGDPGNGEILYALGLAFQEAGQQEEARRRYLSIDPSDPAYRKALVHLAYMDQQTGKVDRGIDMLEAASRMNPEDLALRLYLGAFYEEAGRLEAAADVFSSALEKDPDDGQIRYRLGIVLDKMGKREDAIQQMEILITQNPDHANALNYLGYTLTEMNSRMDEAEAFIARALKLKPGDGYIIDSMGWVYFRQGKAEKALPYLEQAARLLPEDPTILEHLGDAYRHVGRLEDARKAYEKSLLFHKNEDVAQKLESLDTAELPEEDAAP